jgi:hypothetical protein
VAAVLVGVEPGVSAGAEPEVVVAVELAELAVKEAVGEDLKPF